MGEIKNGEQKDSEWSGAIESYFLTEKDGGTELNAEMDSSEEYVQYFEGTFPKALEKIKQLAEN